MFSNLKKVLNRTVNQLDEIEQQLIDPESYHQLSYYEYHTINHLYHIITPNSYTLIKNDPYHQVVTNAIKSAEIMLNQLIDQEGHQGKFAELVQMYQGILWNVRNSFVMSGYEVPPKYAYHQTQSWILLIIHFYKFFQSNYTVQSRRLFKRYSQFLANPDLKNPIACLRFLQNNRIQVQQLQKPQQFLKNVNTLLYELYQRRSQFLEKQYQDMIPSLSLINLAAKNVKRRKVVNIWISGFLSEDMDKKSHWEGLTEIMPDSQIYALQWKSDSITALVKFIGISCLDILKADKMKQQLQTKFTQNPFIPALKSAKILGIYLAQILLQNFPNQFLNLVGYSLASQLILSCMSHLILKQRQHLLNNIYILGGVTDTVALENAIKKSRFPLSVYNCYTQNDMVLKHILGLCLPDVKPVGIYVIDEKQVKGHRIRNVQCSQIVSGHLAYMSKFKEVGRMLDMQRQ